MTTISVELSEGKHTIRVSKDGYDTLTAEIDVGSSSVSCVSVNGVTPGRCGQSTGPGVVASGWNVTVSLKEATTAGVCSWIAGLSGGWKSIEWRTHVLEAYYVYIGATGHSVGFSPVTWNDVLALYYYYIGKDSDDPSQGNNMKPPDCGFT